MIDDLVDLKLDNQLGNEEHGTLTPKTNPADNMRPDRSTNPHDHDDPAIEVHLALCDLREPTAHEGPDPDRKWWKRAARTNSGNRDSRPRKRPHRNSWLLTFRCHESAYPMYVHWAGERMLRLPFEPLAAGRARLPLPVVVRLDADRVITPSRSRSGDGAAVLVHGDATVVDTVIRSLPRQAAQQPQAFRARHPMPSCSSRCTAAGRIAR